MAGPVTIACPMCRVPLPVPCEVVTEDHMAQQVVVRMDARPLREHLVHCDGPPVAPPAPKRSTEVARMGRPVPEFIAAGNRFCTGCGVRAAVCLRGLQHTRRACCALCAEGDSHPTPGAQVPCAEWGQQHGAPAEG